MTYERIKELSKFIPIDSKYFRVLEVLGDFDGIESNSNASVNRFICCYKDLMFGWRFIKTLVDSNIDLPSTVTEPYLVKAYQMERYGIPDEDIVEAIGLTRKSMQYFNNLLKSLLLTEDATYESVAEASGIRLPVVKAFESLFYNIMDRKKEAAWLASHVYPEFRFSELMDNYIKNESLGTILQRTGYNTNMNDVLYLAGFKNDKITKVRDASEMAMKLEGAIMANGYFLARAGFLNQRNASGLSNAKNLIAASKQAGNDTNDKDYDGVGSLSDALMSELLKYNEPKREVEREYRSRLDEGELTDKETIIDIESVENS